MGYFVKIGSSKYTGPRSGILLSKNAGIRSISLLAPATDTTPDETQESED
jgi:hypothetical protein